MLRSAGYFQLVPCPFWLGPGSCQRPYCQYRHVTPTGGTERTSAQPQAVPGPPKEALGKNIQELERLNKAIEAVKNEVEEKQKKLLLYKNVTQAPTEFPEPQIDCNSNVVASLDEEHEVIIKSALVPTVHSSKKSVCSPHLKKYVVDRRCPATDLEYDPLLNYSAGLFGSASKESDKSKLKRVKSEEALENVPHKKPRAASPIRLEIKLQESDDDVLVIDAPPLQTVARKQRSSKFPSSKEQSNLLDAMTNTVDNSAPVSVIEILDTVSPTENDEECVHSEIESKPIEVSPEECLTSFADNVDEAFDVKNDGLISKETIATIEASYSQEQNGEQNEVKIYSPLNYRQNFPEQTQLEDSVTNPKCEELKDPSMPEKSTAPNPYYFSDVQELAEPVCPVPSEMLTFDKCEVTEVISSSNEQECEKATASVEEVNDIIVLNSSSEAEDSDADLSESDDPMEECLRIFNEFNESEKNKNAKQSFQDQSESDIPEAKGSDVVPGQKKRIAHPSAKCEVKSSGSILVPYRGPTPQQIPHARILHVQQQAVQITAAVKNGQAFVASAQKKITGCMSPAFHNFGPMVCLNLVEVQPVVPCRNQYSALFQGGPVTATFRSSVPQKRTLQTAPMKISTRRKPSVVQESGSKVPHETRQRYVNSFVEEFLKDSTTVQEAFDKALNEEKAIYDRCGSKNMYLNIAVNSLKKIRDQRNMSNGSQQSSSKEHAPGSRKQEDKLTGLNLYNLLKDYLLSDKQLQENGYPQQNPEKPGSALLHNVGTKTIGSDALRRVCCRCGEVYSVTLQGKHVRKEECTYHSGKVLRHRVPGGMETRYSCCEAAVGSPGCQMAKLHVHDGQKENLDGFIKTFIKLQPSDGNPGVYSVDCEMCYTTHGLELTRVTVVDPSLKVVYDTFVKPDNEIIDYNTRFSGVTEENLSNITTSIRDVQAIMLNLFSADTILIGHSLENDLLALKLFHDTVVDTSIVFPHRLGLPHKRALRNLMADNLRRIIQDNVGGHDSSEDAAACMELMLWKVKEDTKGRR
ncbi:LOW QUALITY PROTEIN: RNA exonuclease 1 homolog [Pelodytes ibericus]